MATSARITSYVGLLSFLLAVGCSSSPDTITPGPANGGGTGKNQSGVGSTPSSNSNGKPSNDKAIEIDVSQAGQLKTTCGNSTLDTSEQCDDGNTEGGDGCTPLCQRENEWDCPTAGQPCVSTAVCGDGILNTNEICDDKNNEDGDGCKGDCSAKEDGWQCRVPGKDCVPLCGDSVLTGSEKCDDGNSDSGDGCSSTCQVEKGYDCGTDLPSECKQSECGNSVQEAGEGCDLGEENGLFYGVAGKGCSKTCTKEPDCRAGGKTQACTATCGDANIDKGAGEECDDGNAASGDGCSDECKLEDGFNCEDETKPDTQKCPTDKSKDCLLLPVIYRDFDGANVNGGHPDFFYMGKNGPDGKKTICVPNANGETATSGTNCSSTDAVDFCTELVKAELGADGKPQLNAGRSGGLTCECRFTDWDKTNALASATSTTCTVEGDGSTRSRVGYPTPLKVQVIKDEESFKQWYNDSSEATTVKGVLELASIGNNLYQFSSSTPGAKAGAEPLTVKDDIHAIFMGDQTQLTSGFFPLEETSRQKICNIWPYWVSGLDTASTCVAKEGGVVDSQWDPEGSYTKGTAGTGGPVKPVKGMLRNFYFTSEVRYLFRYDSKKSGTLKFFGDDDVWVFINGKLAIDLGAPHERLAGSVAVNGAKFGLEDGKTYEIVVFHADRHPRESNYQLTVFGFETTRTLCESACGNGVRTAGEECDDGDDNKEGGDAYNACNSECKFGPFCGDGDINGPDGAEECDNGTDNGQPYGTPDGCTTACTKVHFCGDGYIDGEFEECDGGGACDKDCKAIVKNI